MVPYTYIIGWSKLNKYYYGVRYAKISHPSDLWVTYFTSSKRVKEYHTTYGDPDIIEIRKVFNSIDKAREWEHIVLRRLNVINNEKWLNNTDNKAFPDRTGIKESIKTCKKKSEFQKGNINHKGKLASEETKQKMREARKGKPSPNKGKILSKEWCENLSKSKLGKQKSINNKANYSNAMKSRWEDENYKKRLIAAISKITYYIISIDGKITKTNNLREWCDENKININTIKDTYKSRKFSNKYGYLLFSKIIGGCHSF